MAKRLTDPPFFVGYMSRPPAHIVVFVLVVAIGLLLGAAASSFVIGASTTDPGDARFIGGRANFQTYVGMIEERPYPILRAAPSAEHPKARTYMLTAPGKAGVHKKAAELKGQIIDAGGFILQRGTMDMLQVGGKNGLNPAKGELTPAQTAFTPAPPVPLGRWRLTGEICDGKCYAGAMRPGRGLSHKACANLCLIGGVPPVFVSTGTVEGSEFFLLADQDGGPLPDDYFDLVAVMIELEGEVERLDDILVFKVDLANAKVQ